MPTSKWQYFYEYRWRQFYLAKDRAYVRGVPFLLTREQFVGLWERALGPDWRKFRGQHRGQYCMGRFGDRGAYELGNVEIILSTENVSHAKTGRYNFSHLNGILSLPA